MEEKTKHIIARTVYTICKVLARELRLALKPLGIGIIILTIFLTIAEWSDVIFGHNCKEPFGILGIIGFFLPVMIKYYKRNRVWVLKWK
ncbi:hypothetical protein [Leyella stercorea]|jgi:hypothetical protein|uniref:hypothetical protein n=1 Tax=Leyella stercorea TaxID=363265 RepID=UPI0026DD2F19|nr:hypothetical protein [Leyella stercorea]